jgi:hypothetical protein
MYILNGRCGRTLVYTVRVTARRTYAYRKRNRGTFNVTCEPFDNADVRSLCTVVSYRHAVRHVRTPYPLGTTNDSLLWRDQVGRHRVLAIKKHFLVGPKLICYSSAEPPLFSRYCTIELVASFGTLFDISNRPVHTLLNLIVAIKAKYSLSV